MMTRAAAELFCKTVWKRDVEQCRAAMGADAQRLIDAGRDHHTRAGAKRWAARQLDGCINFLACPPPPELVRLIELQLGVAAPPRANRLKNREKRNAAIAYVAEHPDAKPRAIVRAIDYDEVRVIKRWLEDAEFQDLVRKHRACFSLEKSHQG